MAPKPGRCRPHLQSLSTPLLPVTSPIPCHVTRRALLALMTDTIISTGALSLSSPLPPLPHPTPSSYRSPPSSLTSNPASPYSILHRIHSIYLGSQYYAPIPPSAPPLLPLPPPSPPRQHRNVTSFAIRKPGPRVAHTCGMTPFDI